MSVAVGVALEISATMFGTVGKQLVSYSARVESKMQRKALKIMGLTITTVLGPILDFGAYAFAPQAVVGPLAGLDLVWNMCSAPFTLGDRLTRRHIIGTVLVAGGAILPAVFGPHSAADEAAERPRALAQLQSIFLSARFALYLIAMLGLLAALAFVLRRRPKGVGDRVRGLALGASAGAIMGQMYFVSAGQRVFKDSAKTDDWSAFENWLPYMVIAGAVACAVGNIPLMTKGLQEYESIFMVTLFEGCHISFTCISGSIVLREMDREPAWRIAAYWSCIALILLGLLIIQGAVRGNHPQGLMDGPVRDKSSVSEDINETDSGKAHTDSQDAPETLSRETTPEKIGVCNGV